MFMFSFRIDLLGRTATAKGQDLACGPSTDHVWFRWILPHRIQILFLSFLQMVEGSRRVIHVSGSDTNVPHR